MVAAPSSPGHAAMSPEGSRAPSRVSRLRGLPYSATEDEIIKFFSEFTLEEVYICRRDGRATGEAYVMFIDAAEAGSAMETCNKKYLGSRYIEMFEAGEADLAAVKKVLEDTQLQGCVVRLRGLPYTATAEDVAAFFEGVQFADGDDAVVFTMTVDGRPTGECYVELADREAQNSAMMRHKELMGTRYIEIFHSNKMDKLQAQQQRLCMPPPNTFSRWGAQATRPGMPLPRGMAAGNMQPAVFAAAAAGGNKLACRVDHITGSLQGTHISNNPVGRLMSPVQQQPQQLYQQPYPQRQVMVQPHIVTIPAAATGPGNTFDSSSSNVSTGNSLPSMGSGSLAVSTVSSAPGHMAPVMSPAAVNGAYYQGSPAAVAMSQPGGVMHPGAVRMTPYGVVPTGNMYGGGAMGASQGPMQQQQLPQQVYYMPVQQGSMPPSYGVPTAVYSMSSGPTTAEPPHMMQAGPPRPMLVGDGQWMHAPPQHAWPQQGWPAAGMRNPAAMGMPAGGGGMMQ